MKNTPALTLAPILILALAVVAVWVFTSGPSDANFTSRCIETNTRVWESSKSNDFQMWYDETCK